MGTHINKIGNPQQNFNSKRKLKEFDKMSDKEKEKEKEKSSGGGESKPGDLGLLEEDDEFEEFPAEDWTCRDEDPSDVNVWEDNWDDDNVEDDFSVQLKSELESQGVAMEQ